MIAADSVYAKTAAGAEELRARKIKLAPRLRTMLIMVDGEKSAGILREEALKVGAPGDFLEQLEKVGLVEALAGAAPSSGEAGAAPRLRPGADAVERFQAAQKFMNDTVVNALGIKAFFFTLKLERCSTLDDLRALADDYREAIAKASGAAEGELLAQRLAEILG